jgi:hypothetical protein
MKLSDPITIKPPAISDHNGKIFQPPELYFTELMLMYFDNPHTKTLSVSIQQIPQIIVLYENDEYDAIGDWTKKQAEAKLLNILGDNPAKYLRSLFVKTLEENPYGAGTLLSQMIKSLGIQITSNCACKQHAIEMNENGNDWCKQNIDMIVGWLKQEAKKKGLPFFDTIGRLMVDRAIKKSRRLLANQSVPEDDNDLDNL